MKVEQLLVLASARGISLDLGRPRRRQIPADHRAAPRRRDAREKGTEGPEDPGDPGIPGVVSALGGQSSSHQPPQWTAVDLDMAAAGMRDLEWKALCWCIALETPARGYLKGQLLQVAVELREAGHLPKTLNRGDCDQCGARRHPRYLEDLCTLALLEGANPDMWGSEAARARFFAIPDHVWRRQVSKLYQEVYGGHLQRWYLGALAHLRDSLRELDEHRAAQASA